MSALRHPLQLVPGIVLSVLVAAAALAAAWAEQVFLGEAWLEGLVLAILFGAAISSVARLSPTLRPGIDFCAKAVLEVAIVLLGASISLAALGDAGFGLVGGIVGVV